MKCGWWIAPGLRSGCFSSDDVGIRRMINEDAKNRSHLQFAQRCDQSADRRDQAQLIGHDDSLLITGIADCCARAASGHAAAAPPSSATNSRRPMPDMGGPSLRDYRIVSLPPGRPVGPWGKPELF